MVEGFEMMTVAFREEDTEYLMLYDKGYAGLGIRIAGLVIRPNAVE